MKFSVNQKDLQNSLNYCQGVIEKKSTLPILSNVLIDAKDERLKIIATDLDLIFIQNISNIEIFEDGQTTTSCSVMYDIVRKFNNEKKINFHLVSENKINLESDKSSFNLNCLKASEFPITEENFRDNEFTINSKKLLKLLNKCKFSISNDETRHYLSGIFLHLTENESKKYLTAVSTDSHRMAITKTLISNEIQFDPIILPKKTIFQLCALLDNYDGELKISNLKSKIKFEFNNTILISKLIDGKFPNYFQVIPKDNQKKLEIDLKPFLTSVDRVASVSTDKKDGLRMSIANNNMNLSVNNSNSGDGKESLSVKFDSDLDISFNPRYLLDVASNMDGNTIEIFLKDSGSPALIKDPSDFDSIYVIMPMKG